MTDTKTETKAAALTEMDIDVDALFREAEAASVIHAFGKLPISDKPLTVTMTEPKTTQFGRSYIITVDSVRYWAPKGYYYRLRDACYGPIDVTKPYFLRYKGKKQHGEQADHMQHDYMVVQPKPSVYDDIITE